MTSQAELNALVCAQSPPQGAWSDEAYLRLTDHCRCLVEFTDGFVEQLPMPTSSHQLVALYIYRLFHAYLHPLGGVAMAAPLRMRIREGKYREPDVLLLQNRLDDRFQDRFWLGADLAVEVVNPDKPSRDWVDKRKDYAAASIPEYWIADPRDETVTVFVLEEGAYAENAAFGRGDTATSRLLDGLTVDVAAMFDEAKP